MKATNLTYTLNTYEQFHLLSYKVPKLSAYTSMHLFSTVLIISATDYGLDSAGSNPGGDEIYRPSRPALGPTQPPLQWIPGLSRG